MDLELILPLAIALFAAIFISLPFFTGGKGDARDEHAAAPDPRAERLRELHSRKDSLLSAINDIELITGSESSRPRTIKTSAASTGRRPHTFLKR